MNCSACGRKLKKGQTVCPSCGAKTGGTDSEYGFSSKEDQFVSSEDAFDLGTGGFPAEGPAAAFRPRRSGGGLKWLLALAAVLVIAGAAVLLLIPKKTAEEKAVRGFAAPTGQWEWIDSGRRLLTNELLVTMKGEGTRRDLETALETLDGAVVGYFPELKQYQVRFNTGSRTELAEKKTALENLESVGRADWQLLILPEESSLTGTAGAWPAGAGETLGLLGAFLPGTEETGAAPLLSQSFPNREALTEYGNTHPGLPETENGKIAEALAADRNVITAPAFYLEENPDGTLTRYTTTGAVPTETDEDVIGIAELADRGARVIGVPFACAAVRAGGEDPWLPAEAEQTRMLAEALAEKNEKILLIGSAAVFPAGMPDGEDFLSAMLRGAGEDRLITVVSAAESEPMLNAAGNGLAAVRMEGWTDGAADFAAEGGNGFHAAALTGIRAAKLLQENPEASGTEIARKLRGEAAGIAFFGGKEVSFVPLLKDTAGSGGAAAPERLAAVRVTARDSVTGAAVTGFRLTGEGGDGITLPEDADSAWVLTETGSVSLKAEAPGYEAGTLTCTLSEAERAAGTGEAAVTLTGDRAETAGSVKGTIRFPDGSAGRVLVSCRNTETGEIFEIPAAENFSARMFAGGYELSFRGTDLMPGAVYQVAVAPWEETELPEIEMARINDLPGSISGLVTDALTGRALEGVRLDFFPGVNAPTEGTPAFSVMNGSDGNYTGRLPGGAYTMRASMDGYVSISRTVFIWGERANENQNFSLSPMLPEGQVRIVLEWGATPSDLDSHLVNNNQGIHIYFSEKTAPSANLDVDDTSSYGPETTTISQQLPGKYTFYVQDYTNHDRSSDSRAMADSGARVTVYIGNGEPRVFEVPNLEGTLWEVFSLENGVITPSGTVTYFTGVGSVGK